MDFRWPHNQPFPYFWVSQDAYALGESPAWCPTTQTLSWVDIEDGRLVLAKRTASDAVEIFEERVFPDRLGFAIPCGQARYLLGLGGSLAISGPRGTLEVSDKLLLDGHRFNDARVNHLGQLLIGTLSLGGGEGTNYFARLRKDGEFEVLANDVVLGNGICLSPHNNAVYFVDSGKRRIERWSIDSETGAFGKRTVFFEIEEAEPDGIVCDAQGNLWVALWGAGKILSIGAGGKILRTFDLEGSRYVTSLCFWGANLDDVCVTSASIPFAEDRSQPDTLAGRTFAGFLGTSGLVDYRWSPVDLNHINPIITGLR